MSEPKFKKGDSVKTNLAHKVFFTGMYPRFEYVAINGFVTRVIKLKSSEIAYEVSYSSVVNEDFLEETK